MNRTTPSPKILELAQWLLAYEASGYNPSGANMAAVFRVGEKLRRPLSRLAGAAGFRSLLARALMLAKAQAPGFSAVQINADGSLEELSDLGNPDQSGEAGVMLIAQLLGLLVTFIGESLMLSLVHEAWPDSPSLIIEPRRKSNHDPTR